MASIKIVTGQKTYDIEDQFGNVRGQIRFNPSDINFVNRLAHMEDKIQKYIDEFDKTRTMVNDATDEEIQSDALDDVKKSLAALEYYDGRIKEIVDETFGKGTSEAVFNDESVFNLFEGLPFITRFMDSILPVIKDDIEKASKVNNEKIANYTAHTFEK